MPSLVNASRQWKGVNGTTNGSEPPRSSLIAAHLAPTNGSTLPHFDNEDFSLLLKESLGSDEDGQPNLGTDVTLNHKLICVIIKAGLETIDRRSNDPFRKDNDLYHQIQSCIEVIDLAVERTPEALFVSSKSEDLSPRAENVPLFFWLIPKLLSLLTLDKDDSRLIAERTWPLLGKILASAKHCPRSFGVCTSISTYIEGIIEGSAPQTLSMVCLTTSPGLLSYFEQLDFPGWKSRNPSFTFSPDPSELFASSLAKLNLGDAKLPDTIYLGSLGQGIDTTCGLLRLLATSVFTQSNMVATAMKRCVISILDQNQRLWNLLLGFLDCSPTRLHSSSHLLEHFFLVMQDLVLSVSQPQWQGSVRRKVFSLWAKCIAEMVHISQASSFEVMANEIISALAITTEVSARATGLALAVCEILQPAAKTVLHEEMAETVVHAQIQVREIEQRSSHLTTIQLGLSFEVVQPLNADFS